MPLPNGLSLLITFEFSTIPAYTIILIPLSPISDTNIPNLVANLHPPLTTSRNRTNLAQGPVGQARHDEASEEVDVVDVFGTLRHRLPNGSNKPDNVDQDAADVRGVSAPVETKGEVVRCCFASRIEVGDLVIAAADDVVVADDDARDRGKEDGVGGQVSSEVIGGGEEVPIDE